MSSQQSVILTCLACLMFACTPCVLLGAPPDACSLLTVAEVNAALGVSTVPPKAPAKICRWGESGGQAGQRAAVVVTIQDTLAFSFAKKPSTSTNVVKTPVSGIGDDAVFNTIGSLTATLTVKKADTYFEVHVYGFPLEQTKTIEKTFAQEIVIQTQVKSLFFGSWSRKENSMAKNGKSGPATLAIDVGGSGLKASVLDAKGGMLCERARVETPEKCTPEILVDALAGLVKPLPKFDRISVGFPGVVRNGVIHTAPNLGTDRFAGFDLAQALSTALGAPTRVLNDADVQGFAAIQGHGLEMVITLGTGLGSAMFLNGAICPHLEFAHHPFHKGATYEDLLGNAARKADGEKRWSRNVHHAIGTLRALVNFDHLYIGGGNAKKLKGKLPDDVSLVDNTAGILGGIKLWG